MSFEIHTANPSAPERQAIQHAMRVLHEEIKREVKALRSDEDPAGRLLMVMQDGKVLHIPDLSRTSADADIFVRQMRRVVANVKPSFVVYANICQEEEGKGEAMTYFAESARRVCAIGKAPVERAEASAPSIGPMEAEFMGQGDVLVTSVGAFFAGVWGDKDAVNIPVH